jgi:hypothetical protein
MRTLTRFVAAVLTAAVVPACSVIASPVAHTDPVATTATVLKVVDGDTVDIVDYVRGRLPKCHRSGVASRKSFVVIDPSRAVQPKLGDGDVMDRRIKLPITVFRSTHPFGGASGPVRNRGQTGMLRKRGLTGETGGG